MPKINAEGHATYAENIEQPGVEPQEVAPFHEPPSDAPGQGRAPQVGDETTDEQRAERERETERDDKTGQQAKQAVRKR